MGLARNMPLPIQDPISLPRRPEYRGALRDPQEGLLSPTWIDALTAQQALIDSMPARVASVVIRDGAAVIGATDMTDGTLSTGQYELQWWYGVTTPAAISSELQVTFDWQYRGAARSVTGPNLSANTTDEFDTDTLLIPITGGTPVRYSVGYITGGVGAPMLYDLFICLKQVPM